VALSGGTAVRRNLLRRRLREIARRRILPRLASVDVVVKSRPPAYDADFDTLAKDLEQWLSSL
jgi:ribonuclease P protein component